MAHTKRPAQGFTLIELLVVIAIIAILAGMLLPVLSRARRHARGVDCISSMRQVSLGIFFYSGDNAEFLPGQEWKDASGTTFRISAASWQYTTDLRGRSLAVGTTIDGQPLYVNPSTQHLLALSGYQDLYLWCKDMAHQREMESYRFNGGPSSIRPAYTIAHDMSQHHPCQAPGAHSAIGSRRTNFGDDSYNACDHLQRLLARKPGALLLGEMYSSSFHAGAIGHVNLAFPDRPYLKHNMAFRHPGRRANVILQDGHAETWKYETWEQNYQKTARGALNRP